MMAEQPQELTFFVNGQKITEWKPDPESSLLQYLRRKLLLPGTKEGCGHGGCGSCTVMISRYDRTKQRTLHYTVNACLFPLCAVHGLAVTTVEGVGNPRTGLHDVQKRLIQSHGVQCGFCTPGFVMSIFTLLRNNHQPTRDELEMAIEGNLCRCTGYRPIVEAFKTLTKDGCPMGADCCQNRRGKCETDETRDGPGTAMEHGQVAVFPAELKLSDQYDRETVTFKGKQWTWIRPTTLDELLVLKNKHPHAPVIMGNTTTALHLKQGRFDQSPVLLFGGSISALKATETDDNGIFLGAALTMSEMAEVITKFSTKVQESRSKYFNAVLEMVKRYGADQIRNVATLSGSVLSKRSNSDVITLLHALDARMTLSSVGGERKVAIDKNPDCNEVITAVHIPYSTEDDYVMFFKQAERSTFSLAIVNAGMRVRFNADSKVTDIKLCYGGVGKSIFTGNKTTEMALGRSWNMALLSTVLSSISKELGTEVGDTTHNYKANLVASFFYRFFLVVQQAKDNTKMSSEMLNATESIPLLPCEGIQLYDPCTEENQPDTDSVGRPVTNIASESLVSGEAVFLDDIPRVEGELFLAPVTSTKAHARIISVDTSKALALEGVHGYVSHTDIPGKKMFGLFGYNDEPVFASDEVDWYGQPIGGIVAESREVATKGAGLVEIKYETLRAILTIQVLRQYAYLMLNNIQESIDRKWLYDDKPRRMTNGDVAKAFKESDCIVEGEYYTGLQEHFYLETQCSLARPIPEGDEMEVTTASQNLLDMQEDIRSCLKKPSNKVVCRVKRLGGGFGGKETRCAVLPAVIAANKYSRPVRYVLSRQVDMLSTGKRHPCLGRYKLGATKSGQFKGLELELFFDAGHNMAHAKWTLNIGMLTFEAGTKVPDVDVKGYICRTNTPPNTAFRAYGAPEACLVYEDAIFKLSCRLGISQDKIREINLYKEGDLTAYHMPLTDCTMEALWLQCQQQAEYDARDRAVAEFNKGHRWKKRGLTMTTEKFAMGFASIFMHQTSALVHIYKDGSVRLSHGGVEMGQGLNTKMIQVASRELGVPIEKFFTSETSTATEANACLTAASLGTDIHGPAVMEACKILHERLKPLSELHHDATWEELISMAYLERVKLSAVGFSRKERHEGFDEKTMKGKPCDYFTYGSACSEVEVDVLTGEHRVLRTDIVMDVGKSLNPAIDIGQIEGGFVQGLGMVTIEDITIDKEGRTTNCSPVAYKIPNVRSIPRQFNVTLMKNPDVVSTVYSSKGIGEPPLLLSISVIMAIKEAVRAARAEIGLQGYFRLDSPATVAKIQQACGDQLQSLKA